MTNSEYQYFFHAGTLQTAYEYLGCHYDRKTKRAIFRVWAPHADSVSVIGDFNFWDKTANYMFRITESGIYEGIIDNVEEFQAYKYFIRGRNGHTVEKADPYGFMHETQGSTASKVISLDNFLWNDDEWLARRKNNEPYSQPINVYECNIASWRKYPDGNFYDYRKFADEIVDYLKYMNYTHLELMGIAEHPFDGSWGYQVTGYFAPTSRYGRPEDFAYLVNKCHDNGIAVILDWVPGHFPKDEHGLYNFDGEPCYEPEHPLRSEHKEWGTMCFDYGRNEVKSFLVSNAMMWFDKYHVDGLRVDAVASMLYLDYGRNEWLPNAHGGRENTDAVDFFRLLNTAVFDHFPGILMVAEESTAWPMVTKPADWGGLGFNFKWNMGWMNDTLSYIKSDPFFRQYKHNMMTFSMEYAFSENYVLPISHDEVVYGKGSLINKMPGDHDLKFAGVRNYLTYMYGHPGKKLLFMGNELGQWAEWDWKKEIDWVLTEYPQHKGLQTFIKELNRIYKETPALYEIENSWDGFEWLVDDDSSANVLAFERRDKAGNRILIVINYAPTDWKGYRLPVNPGKYTRLLRTSYYGWDQVPVKIKSEPIANRKKTDSLIMDIESMSGYMFYCPAPKPKKTRKNSATKTTGKAETPKTTKTTKATKTTKRTKTVKK
ncbi:MAG: 1,4-alpha-glucan branching protein GlgB [Clostridia bacterium]|nr:1,4-alpha-glucan branching protein GlgB [Clostridia bacterium]